MSKAHFVEELMRIYRVNLRKNYLMLVIAKDENEAIRVAADKARGKSSAPDSKEHCIILDSDVSQENVQEMH